jgi:hypothetical protein
MLLTGRDKHNRSRMMMQYYIKLSADILIQINFDKIIENNL